MVHASLRQVAACIAISLASAAFAQDPPRDGFVTIATGSITAVYHAAGSALCRVIHARPAPQRLRCAVVSTGGSIANLRALRAGEVELAFAQSDAQHRAFHGTEEFAKRPMTDLRAVLALYPEPLTLVVAPEAGVRSFTDLRGKRINAGNLGSGTRALVEQLLAAAGWTRADFSYVGEARADEHGPALCDGKIDAFFFVVGHPSANIQEPLRHCRARIVPIDAAIVGALVGKRPDYAMT